MENITNTITNNVLTITAALNIVAMYFGYQTTKMTFDRFTNVIDENKMIEELFKLQINPSITISISALSISSFGLILNSKSEFYAIVCFMMITMYFSILIGSAISNILTVKKLIKKKKLELQQKVTKRTIMQSVIETICPKR